MQLFSSFYSLDCVFMSSREKLRSTEGAHLQPLHFRPAAFSAHFLLFRAKLLIIDTLTNFYLVALRHSITSY